MELLFFNAWWMIYNILLAVLAVIFGWLMYLSHKKYVSLLMGAIWLLFIPNTIYILTDLIHISNQLPKTTHALTWILLFQYALLTFVGILTFFYALLPFEYILRRYNFSERKIRVIIVLMNFLFSFGVVLGRIQRTNSWDVFVNIQKVLHDTVYTLTSGDLITLTILFGLLCNFVYFLFYDIFPQPKKHK